MSKHKTIWRAIILSIVLILLWLILNRAGTVHAPTQSNNPAAQTPHWGVQTRTTGCKPDGPLQDISCTPGDIFPDVTKQDICTPGYARSARNVAQSLKNQSYVEYTIKQRLPGQYQIDHLVSLQLGGSNDISNLWPESNKPVPGYHEKDRVENYLRDQVCKGAMTLQDAQVKIATNWLNVYKIMPASSNGSDSDDAS